MQVTIDIYSFNDRQIKDLEFSHEIPGGDTTASFTILTPNNDIDIFDDVSVYACSAVKPVWRGFVASIERDKKEVKVECTGWAARMAHLVIEESRFLENEKASTFIVDHIIPQFSDVFATTTIDTSDATISAKREYQAGQTYRAIIDDVAKLAGFTWFVYGKDFYFVPPCDYVAYRIAVDNIVKSTDVTEYANRVAYSWRKDMTIYTGHAEDTDSPYPQKSIYTALGEIDATTAAAAAAAQLEIRKQPTAIDEITVNYITDVFNIPVSLPSVLPGAKIEIAGDIYMLSKTEYNHDQRSIRLTPSPLIPTTYTTLLARLGGAT